MPAQALVMSEPRTTGFNASALDPSHSVVVEACAGSVHEDVLYALS